MSTVHEKDNKAERPQHIDDSAAASRDSATIIDRQTSQDDMEPMPEVDFARAATIKPSRLHGKSLYFMVSFVAGTGFTLFGYDQGVMSGLLTLPAFIEVFPETDGGFNNSDAATKQSLMVAIYQIGCMLGALCNLYVADKIGRRWTIAIGGIGVVIGTILQAASVNYGMMIFARIFNGIWNGLLTSVVPTYQAECSKPASRGKLLLFSGSLITFGVMTSYWIDLAFFYTSGQISWRFPLAFQCIFTFTMLFSMWWFRVPESPRWLVAKGRHEEALAVLSALSGKPVDDPENIKTWHGIVETIRASVGDFALKEILTHGKSQHFRRTALGVLAQCFQQITGINLITYYLSSVLEDMGLDAEMSRIIAGVNGTCYFLTSLVALFIIERLGRRPLMLWTTVLQAGTMAILAGLYEETSRVAQIFSVLMLFLFNTWFSIGWLGMTWLYPAEVTPLRIRAPANALSTASNWLFNFFVVMVTGPMFSNIGWGTYAFFAALNAVIIFPTVLLFFPETKKYSLEDLDLIFAIANEEGKNPVAVSKHGDIPEAGTKEADMILGRKTGKSIAMTEEKQTERRRSHRTEEV